MAKFQNGDKVAITKNEFVISSVHEYENGHVEYNGVAENGEEWNLYEKDLTLVEYADKLRKSQADEEVAQALMRLYVRANKLFELTDYDTQFEPHQQNDVLFNIVLNALGRELKVPNE